MTNKKILVTRPSMPSLDEYVNEIKDLWESHWITNMGDKHEMFRRMLCDYLSVPDIELVVNGHMALEMAIQAMGFPKGAEVITTPFTFVSTTHAIVRNGLTPVFCDIDENNYCIDPDKIEDLITEKTCAIVPVHVYGNICDVKKIDNIAKQHGLKVIYDAAHAFGEKKDGIGIANYGDASCFSFHATKVFNSIEGGAVCYRDPALGKRIYNLKNFGFKDEEIVEAVGANAKMNEFAAAMGICNLRHIDEEIESRKKLVERYNRHLESLKGIKIINNFNSTKSNYSYYPIVVDSAIFGANRDAIKAALEKYGFFSRKYFFPLTSKMECYRNIFNPDDTPVADKIASLVLTLPLYADLRLELIDQICEIIVGLQH